LTWLGGRLSSKSVVRTIKAIDGIDGSSIPDVAGTIGPGVGVPHREEQSMSYAEAHAKEQAWVFPWDSVNAPLAKDAVLHAPLFTRPVVGEQPIRQFYQASHATAGPVRVRWSLSGDDGNLIIGDHRVDGNEVFSGFWLRRDASGAVIELSHAMRPFTHLPPYHDAMRRQLAGLVSDEHWELDEAARVTAPWDGKGTFPPMSFEEDARLFSPLVGEILQGGERVRSALAQAGSVYGTRRYLAAFRERGLLGQVWDAALDGHVVRGVGLIVISPAGAVKDVIGCMRPYCVQQLIYRRLKEGSGIRPEHSHV
jgi:hypothetical protein